VAAIGALVLLCTGVCLAALVALHVVARDYRPLRDPVSAYGAGRYRLGYWVAATSIGIAGLLTAAAFAHFSPEVSRRVVVLLVAFGLARIAIPYYPMDLAAAAPTRTGRMHWLLAAVAFTAICWGGAEAGSQLAWGSASALEALAWVATAGAAGTVLSARRIRALRPLMGGIERVFYAGMIGWFLVVGLHLI
jgi:hypothetical protein